MAVGAFEVVTHAIAASDSLEHISRALYGALDQMALDASGSARHEYHQRVSVIVGDRVLTGFWIQRDSGARGTRSARASWPATN